jgi:hypothetical protein
VHGAWRAAATAAAAAAGLTVVVMVTEVALAFIVINLGVWLRQLLGKLTCGVARFST